MVLMSQYTSELSMCTRRQDQDVAFELAYWKMTYKVICSKRRVVLLCAGQVVE